MQTLRRGHRSPQVKLTQRLLSLRLRPPTRLGEDAIYGAKTDQAARQFQQARSLRVDGIVGPNTWRALGNKIDVSQRVTLFPQPTNMSCWSAAATMLFGNRSVGPGSATLGPSGGLRPSAQNVQRFANDQGLHMYYPQSWTVAGLVGLLRQAGPLWVAGWIPSGHAVVYAGIFGDGTPNGTMLLIYDPWPPRRGNIRGEFYGDWVRAHPTATTYILTRRRPNFVLGGQILQSILAYIFVIFDILSNTLSINSTVTPDIGRLNTT